jgi:hypothetical protein
VSWQLYRLQEGQRSFEIVGNGLSWDVDVWEGAMKGDVLHGLRALELPMAGRDLVNAYDTYVPRQAPDGSVNLVPNRCFVVFESQTAPRFVLRFSENVPKELLDALRQAFRGPQILTQEVEDEELGREEHSATEGGTGDRPGEDRAGDRDDARDGRQRPKGYGSQKRVGENRKIPRKRKKATPRKRTPKP